MPTPGVTMWKDFPYGSRTGRSNEDWTQDYVYIEERSGGASREHNGSLIWEFLFTKKRTDTEIATAFRTEWEWRGGVFWPPVLVSDTGLANPVAFEAYDSNGDAYTADYLWKPDIKPQWRGPTRCKVEYFASHKSFNDADAWVTATPYALNDRVLYTDGIVYKCLVAHTSGTFGTDYAANKWAAEMIVPSMEPEAILYQYGLGSLRIEPCLHPQITFTFTTGTSNPRFPPSQNIGATFEATSPTDWPSTIVISDSETFNNGLYIRQKVTAYKPY